MSVLDRYLKSGRVKGVKDPLEWWMKNSATYPCLSQMVRDFLVIPGEFY
jgi:hAT family C-terminal dimerisation region